MITQDTSPLLARAATALERGRGAEVVRLLEPALRGGLRREEELAVRAVLVEAWLLQDDIRQAAAVLGRQPDQLRERLEPAMLATLWRLHGRVASARGEQSRAIALLGRALTCAARAHDSRTIGLVHYELGLCYRQVGDTATVREHISKAAAALHAAGDRRALGLVHSLSGIALAQEGRHDEAMSALRQAERIAALVQADDVVATVWLNQANVALIVNRHEQALALAERSVLLHEHCGSARGLGVSLATLGQICVRLGDLTRAEQVLNRALSVRSSIQLRETTGAVHDTLAQIHLIRGAYDAAEESLRQAQEAYGVYGLQASRWYDWSLRILRARVAVRRGDIDRALAAVEEIRHAPGAPLGYAIQAELIALDALLGGGRLEEAEQRLAGLAPRVEPIAMLGPWGEFLRLRGLLSASAGRTTEGYHDLAQSVSVFDLLGERYQLGLSYLGLGRLVAGAGARSRAERYLGEAAAIFESLGARPDLAAVRAAQRTVPAAGTGDYVGPGADSDDVMVRRLVEAAVLPDLLAREAVGAMLEACGAEAAVLFVQPAGADVRVAAHAGCDADTARVLARAGARGAAYGIGALLLEPAGREADGPRAALVVSPRPFGHPAIQRFRMVAAIARQGFDLCAARERPAQAVDAGAGARSLESAMPGMICASAAMSRVADHIHRLRGSDLTILITGESGTGKELVARAIHVGSPRSRAMFLPYNCTTTTRELADSQLFGHRRGSFTGAVADQPGLIRSAGGGTLFLDEIGDLPLDVQPKLLRFLEEGEILPVGETRPQRVDVRVIAATNADLEQRVAEGKFREDLFYRLGVIRIHVPPLRDRREEIPHLSTYFLRDACERLGKQEVRLGAEALEVLHGYGWPGNVRQLRNEIQRAVALCTAGGTITPELLSPELFAASPSGDPEYPGLVEARVDVGPLSKAVEGLERDLIRAALDRSGGNISETSRVLGLTRRGLYLKIRRLGLSLRSQDVY